jgi:hypothetical protein
MENINNFFKTILLEVTEQDKIFSPDISDDLYMFIKINDNTAKLLIDEGNFSDMTQEEFAFKIKEESFGNLKTKKNLLKLKKGWETSFNKKKAWKINDDFVNYQQAMQDDSAIVFNKTQIKTMRSINKLLDSIEKSKDGKIKILASSTRKNFIKTINIFNNIKKNYSVMYESDTILDLLKKMDDAENRGEKYIDLYSAARPENVAKANEYLMYDKDKLLKGILKKYKDNLTKELEKSKKEIIDFFKKSDFNSKVDRNNGIEFVYNRDDQKTDIYSISNRQKIKKLNEFNIKENSKLKDYIKNGESFLGFLEDKEVLPLSTSTESPIEFSITIPRDYNKTKIQLRAYSTDYYDPSQDKKTVKTIKYIDDDNYEIVEEEIEKKAKGLRIELSDKNLKDIGINEDTFSGFALFTADVFSDDFNDLKLDVKIVEKIVPIEKSRAIFKVFSENNNLLGTPIIIGKDEDFIKKDEAYFFSNDDNLTKKLINRVVPGDIIKGDLINNKIEIEEILSEEVQEFNARYINSKIYGFNKDEKMLEVVKSSNPKIYDKLINRLNPIEQLIIRYESKDSKFKYIERDQLKKELDSIDEQLKRRSLLSNNIYKTGLESDNKIKYVNKKIYEILERKYDNLTLAQKETQINKDKIEVKKLEESIADAKKIRSKNYRDLRELNLKIDELQKQKDELLDKYKKELTPYQKNINLIKENQNVIEKIIEDNLLINKSISDLFNLISNLESLDLSKIGVLNPEQIEEIKNKNKIKKAKRLENIKNLFKIQISKIKNEIKKHKDEIKNISDEISIIEEDNLQKNYFNQSYSLRFNLESRKSVKKHSGWEKIEIVKEIFTDVKELIENRKEIIDFLIENPGYKEDIFYLERNLHSEIRNSLNKSKKEINDIKNKFNSEINKQLNDLKVEVDEENKQILSFKSSKTNIEFDDLINKYKEQENKKNEDQQILIQKFQAEMNKYLLKDVESDIQNLEESDKKNTSNKIMLEKIKRFNENFNIYVFFIDSLKQKVSKMTDEKYDSINKQFGKKDFELLIELLEQYDDKTQKFIELELNKRRLIKINNTMIEIYKSDKYDRIKNALFEIEKNNDQDDEIKRKIQNQLDKEGKIKFKKMFYTSNDIDKITELIIKYEEKIKINNKKILLINEYIDQKRKENVVSDEYSKIKIQLDSVKFKGKIGVLYDDDGNVEKTRVIYIIE